jgi:hypothetical protein
VQLRYNYRLYPTPGQRIALARAFGCARVVFNDAFTGERAAATRALLAYQVYERYDRKLRAMAKTNLAQAIAFDIGTHLGQSDWAFNRWDSALGSVITINENAFTVAIQEGHSTGSPWIALIPAVGTALIIALTIAGTRPRLTEYR